MEGRKCQKRPGPFPPFSISATIPTSATHHFLPFFHFLPRSTFQAFTYSTCLSHPSSTDWNRQSLFPFCHLLLAQAAPSSRLTLHIIMAAWSAYGNDWLRDFFRGERPDNVSCRLPWHRQPIRPFGIRRHFTAASWAPTSGSEFWGSLLQLQINTKPHSWISDPLASIHHFQAC